MDPESFIGTAMESWLCAPAFQNQLISGSGAGTVVTSEVIDTSLYGRSCGMWALASSATTPDLRVWYEMSYDTDPNHYVVPDIATDVFAPLGDKVPHVVAVTLPPMRYMRVRASGSTSNPADTLFNAVLFLHQ